mgnify:CR=1 FL=1
MRENVSLLRLFFFFTNFFVGNCWSAARQKYETRVEQKKKKKGKRKRSENSMSDEKLTTEVSNVKGIDNKQINNRKLLSVRFVRKVLQKL